MQMLANEPMGGITSGLEDNESVQALSNVTSGIETLFQNIDQADNPKEIMDAIRGDEASVDERRMELAQLVGEQDAKQTPESVLTIVQPLMTVIESTGGIADLDTETPVAQNIDEPQQMEAMARMMANEPTAMLSVGSNPTGNPEITGLQAIEKRATTPLGLLQLAKSLGPDLPRMQDFTTRFEGAPSVYDEYAKVLPFTQLAKFGQIVGRSPTVLSAITAPETTELLDPIMKLAMVQAKEKQDLRTKALEQFTKAKQSAQEQRTGLIKSILPTIAGKEVRFEKLDDGTVYKINPDNTIELFEQGTGKTIEIDGNILQFNKKTRKFDVAYSAPGANLKEYSTPKGTYLINFNQKDADGRFKVTPLMGGLTNEEINAKYFKFIDTGDGGGIGIDTRKPTIINEDTGLTVLNPLFEVQGKDKTSTIMTDAGAYVVNETDGSKSFLVPGTGKKGTFSQIGNDKTGYRLFNNISGEVVNVPGLGPVKTEFQQQMDEYVRNTVIINNPDKHGALTVENAKTRNNILGNILLPKSTEFDNLRDSQAELFRKTLMKTAGIDADSTDIDKRVNDFIFNLNTDRLNKLTYTGGQYDPQKSLKDVYGKMLGKLQEDTAKRARDSEALNKNAKLISLIKDNTKTGATAPIRLAIGKFFSDIGAKQAIIEGLGITEADYNSFIGGTLENLEMANKIGAQFAVQFASSFPGNLNESEVKLIKEAGINLTTTKGGIEIMGQIFEAEHKRNLSERKLINDYMADPSNSSKSPMVQYAEIEAKLIKNRADNPLITGDLKERLTGLAQEQPNMFVVKGNPGQTATVTPGRLALYKIISGVDATGENDFLSKGGAELLNDYAKKSTGNPKAKYKEEDIKKLFRIYSQFDLKTNPLYDPGDED